MMESDGPSSTSIERHAAPALSHSTSTALLGDVFELGGVSVSYGSTPAVADVTMAIPPHEITALIGPSGCGKSTLLRTLNRMNDLVPTARLEGTVTYHGADLYAPDVDPVEVRRRIGMVFQKPNPFPKSIYENVALGPRVLSMAGSLDDRVEAALKGAALWDEVKHNLKQSGRALSGGQQQRLCIARALAADPEVILMDEPCSALDPIATLKIEELMLELKRDYTIVIVTHNLQQAARVADRTAFLSVSMDHPTGERVGRLIEYGRTDNLFTNASDQRTQDYLTGRFG